MKLIEKSSATSVIGLVNGRGLLHDHHTERNLSSKNSFIFMRKG